jgi:5-methylcytosine-specific restriction endonuclease McrA
MMQPSPFLVTVREEEIRRERRKAKELRSSQWWKRKRAKGICHYCGKQFPPRELTMDHLVPIIRGGKSTKGNLVPSCKKCNAEKKHNLPFERGNE